MRTAVCFFDGGRSTDQQRKLHVAPLHLRRHGDHLVERRRDQPRQAHDVGALGDGRVEDDGGRDHDAEVHDLVVVAPEHDTHDVLADVVHVALDGGEDHLALTAAGVDASLEPGLLLLGLQVRLEIGDGALHDACALHDLWQEHLAGAEQVADDLHPVHQRALDHLQRTLRQLPGLLGVGLDEVHDAVYQRVRQPLRDRRLPPGQIHGTAGRRAADGLGERDEAVGRVLAPVEQHVLDQLEQVRGDVLVDGELAGVDDTHVEPGRDGVEEEGGVHRLAHHVVAAERERQVGDAAADVRAGAPLLDQRQGVQERLRVAVVLGDAGGDREHVRVEHDVLRREPRRAGEQVVGAPADGDLALGGVGLALLVEGHHDDTGAVVADPAGLLEELLLALLEADRVDHALALHALQPRLQHAPARAVHHDRDPGHLRLGGDQVEERRHRLDAVEQVGVHVDVQQVGAAANLLQRDVHRGLVVAGLDQPPEPGRTGDVGALADHHEAVSGPIEKGSRPLNRVTAGAPPACAAAARQRPRRSWRCAGGGAAAAADDVDHALGGELAEHPAGLRRRLVVTRRRRSAGRRWGARRCRCSRTAPGPRRAGASPPHPARSSPRPPADRRARSSSRTPPPSGRTACGRSGRRW
jgi:hypothetical protein